MREDVKTFGAVEVVLGLMEVSLAAVLTPVQTSFKQQIFLVFISGGSAILMGMCLVLAGRHPSSSCLKVNSIYRLASTLFTAVAFGFMVKHVPYRHRCGDFCYGQTDLVGDVLVLLVTVLLVQTLISQLVLLISVCLVWDSPQFLSDDPDHVRSNTSEPLCESIKMPDDKPE